MIKLNIQIEKPQLYSTQGWQDNYNDRIEHSLQVISGHYGNSNYNLIIIDRDLYTKYKKPLWDAQNKKCAFCEESIKYPLSDVEHFRPFKYSKDIDGNIIHGVYSWLGYEWLNFQVGCKVCNTYKNNHFPLVNELDRENNFGTLLNNEGNLGNESPTLINPRFESPTNHISYDIDDLKFTGRVFIVSSRVDPNDRGKVTIDLLDLNRDKTNQKKEDDSYDDICGKRGQRLLRLIKLLDDFRTKKSNFDSISNNPEATNDSISRSEILKNDKREEILSFMSLKSQFIGLCLWYLRRHTSLWDDFPELHNY